MHLNFDMIKQVGCKASLVAVLGTFLPIGAGLLVMMAFSWSQNENCAACYMPSNHRMPCTVHHP